MKRTSVGLFIVLAIALVWSAAPAPATPARALAQTKPAPGGGAGQGDPRQVIADFVAGADGPVDAEEIVSFLNSKAETAALSESPYGPIAVFNDGPTYWNIAAAALSSTKFVVAYTDVGNSGYGTARVGQVSDTGITYGAEYVFNPWGTAWESVAALSATKFVVAFRDARDSVGKSRVGRVSGLDITYGDARTGFGKGDVEYVSVTALTDTKFVVAYREVDFSGCGSSMLGQVSGMDISYGGVWYDFNSADTAYVSVDALSGDKFVVVYQDVTNSWYGTAIVGEVTGTGISYGSKTVFNAWMTHFASVAALSDTKFVVAYRDGHDNLGKAIVGQVADTPSPMTISYGSEAVFNAANTFLYHSGGVSRLSDDTFIVGYENVSDSDGRVVVGAVAGDGITFGNQVSYNAGSSSFDVTVVGLSESKYVVAWDDESDADRGKSRVGTTPSSVTKLTAFDGADEDYFGGSVATSGDTVVVGAPWEDGAGDDRGAAYVFERDQGGPGNWGQVAKLTASDAADSDRFGVSVSISGDTVVVGAYLENGAGADRGAAYVFERDQGGPNNWGQVTKLTASDAADDDYFGHSVSISGDTVVVGAFAEDGAGTERGAAYVFDRDQGGPDNWGQVTKLAASDAADADYFGLSVSISGDAIVVGAFWEDGAGENRGAAYVFDRDQGGANNWGQVKKLVASDAADDDYFGHSVSISGDTVVVGAYLENGAGTDRGAAYVFERSQGGPNNWGQVKKLVASDAADDDWFGLSVSISGDTVVVGANLEDGTGTDRGAAYVFERDQGGAGNWGQVEKLTAFDAEDGGAFGISVAISGDTVVVGARGADGAGTDRGAAYVFVPQSPVKLYLPIILQN